MPLRKRLTTFFALKAAECKPWTLAFAPPTAVMDDDPSIGRCSRPRLEPSVGERRKKLLKRYEAAFDRQADAARGREVSSPSV